jgi:hypothetical protein
MPTGQQQKLIFHYEKSNMFRVIHADGVHGGISPQLNIHMALFNERQPIPQQITHQVGDKGVIGSEDIGARVQKDGILREVEADVVLSIATAKAMVRWLSDRIAETENFTKKDNA